MLTWHVRHTVHFPWARNSQLLSLSTELYVIVTGAKKTEIKNRASLSMSENRIQSEKLIVYAEDCVIDIHENTVIV